MNILLLGSGGREHALAWKLSRSPLCKNLWIAPGNGGTRNNGTNVNISATDFDALAAFALEKTIDMVVVGPEDPLVLGVVDYFKAAPSLQHIPVIGPDKLGAQLEGSKAFAKQFMMKYNVPTAGYMEFDSTNVNDGLAYINSLTPPIVLKADGLAAGKGVLIIQDKEEAKAALKDMILESRFGDASKKVVIEEFLDGIEFSVFVLTDGTSYKILPPAKDYKRVGEGDTGLNTGGMGAISPVPFVTEELMRVVEETVVKPTIAGIKAEGMDYKGFVYIGLIKVGDEPKVIEYNCRLGDPETEVVIPLLETDLVKLFRAVAGGYLGEEELEFKDEHCATIMLVSGGYPGEYEKGQHITGAYEIEDSLIFHAGTKEHDSMLYTNGGRVIAVTSFGKTLKAALETSLKNAHRIHFDGKNYRKDIGYEFL